MQNAASATNDDAATLPALNQDSCATLSKKKRKKLERAEKALETKGARRQAEKERKKAKKRADQDALNRLKAEGKEEELQALLSAIRARRGASASMPHTNKSRAARQARTDRLAQAKVSTLLWHRLAQSFY
jgi:hypothetical protein